MLGSLNVLKEGRGWIGNHLHTHLRESEKSGLFETVKSKSNK